MEQPHTHRAKKKWNKDTDQSLCTHRSTKYFVYSFSRLIFLPFYFAAGSGYCSALRDNMTRRRKVGRWRRETDKRLNFSIVIDCLVPITSRGRGEAGVIENGLWWKLENIRLYPARYIRYIIISCRRSRKAAAARAGARLEPTLAKLHKRETGRVQVAIKRKTNIEWQQDI